MTAVKAFRDRGIDFDCFEKGSDIGGNWRFENDNGVSSAYRTLHIISSKWNMQYADFPMPEDFPDYGHHSDVLRYFEAYVEHFHLRPHITFRTAVEDVSPVEEGVWEVTLSTGERRRYRNVIVASGHHWDPRWPDFPGEFHGTVLHSHDYKHPEPFAGKRVLVVGIGNSACDIAIDLCRLSQCVYVSTRRSAHVVPKYLLGIPTDQWTRPFFELALPVAVRRLMFRLLTFLTVGNQERYGLPRPKHKLLQEHPTVNQEFLSYVGHGRVKIKPNIRELQGDQVLFEDGSRLPFDVIIYATGYNITFPFLKHNVFEVKDNRVDLYRRVVPPDRPGLYFLGLIQPLGAIMPLAEIQAKWIAGLITGEIALPSPARMWRWIERDWRRLSRRYVRSPRHTIQVDFWDYYYQIRWEIWWGRQRARLAKKQPAEGKPTVEANPAEGGVTGSA
ncbi:MAG: NAD(P)/FAD-dependent oxidoreductase [Calditrichaeota bacterium]|nr:MAG: NAD(P)/FAD-dependent oxidoreductase [Calditrichota bacterium]